MDRRRFLGGLIGAGSVASAASLTAEPRLKTQDRVESLSGYDFEHLPIAQDVSVTGVLQCLSDLGWESGQLVIPRLVVSVPDYAAALYANQQLGNVCEITATNRMPEWAWFVAFGGRRKGSAGA